MAECLQITNTLLLFFLFFCAYDLGGKKEEFRSGIPD